MALFQPSKGTGGGYVGRLAILVIALFITSPPRAADWSKWERDNAVAKERDWLVIRQPGEGFCYLKQSYDRDTSKMEMTTGRSGIPALVTPFYRGITGSVIYQVDDREPGRIPAPRIENAALIQLPKSIIPAMKSGRQLKVQVTPTGQAPTTQVFSLSGFTAASEWLEREECQVKPSRETTGKDGETALDAKLVRMSTGKIQVVGETNLPDGMKLTIGLRNPSANYVAQDSVVIADGKFRSAAFSNRCAALPNGSYEVSISSPLPRFQPASVRVATGSNGEHLKGPAVVEEGGKRRIDWTARRKIN